MSMQSTSHGPQCESPGNSLYRYISGPSPRLQVRVGVFNAVSAGGPPEIGRNNMIFITRSSLRTDVLGASWR